MHHDRRKFFALSLALALGTALGCAGTDTREYARDLNPLVGRAPSAYFIEKYGEPEKRTVIDAHTEVWEFRVADTAATSRSTRANLAISTLLRLTFKDGTLSSWQASNSVR